MPILGILASSRPAFELVGSYDSLATVTVPSGGVASITFAGIPTGYKHLQIRGIAKSDETGGSADSLRLRFNSDTGANYSRHRLYGYNSVIYASGAGSTTYMQTFDYPYSDSGGTNTFGAGVLDILDYANTSKYKTIRNLAGVETNAAVNSALSLFSGSWRNTDAITTITLTTGSGNFVQYSQFALYGIR
jgi:hypothetical protein